MRIRPSYSAEMAENRRGQEVPGDEEPGVLTGGEDSDGRFLTPRRAGGLLGASVLATVAYGIVTNISPLNAVIFFFVFVAVFTGLNYAVWRYD